MSGQEIRKKIDENNRLIESEVSPAVFVLNKKVSIAVAENQQLRAMCKHEFHDGRCIFCDTPEVI